MNETRSRFVSTLALLAVFTLAGWAQTETGQITGTVTDPTGAVVPNAKITVKNTATGANRAVTTTSAGLYVVPNLLPGSYQVQVEAPGFTTQQRNLTLTVGARITVDLQLAVGQTGTTVEVSEAAATVNVDTQTIGGTISSKQIVDLPTISRDPYSLVGTVGNAAPSFMSANSTGGGVGFSLNGQRASSTNVLLNGVANNDEFSSTVGQRVPLDSVQEFSVLTSNFTAEYGRASGGIVNAITRSGTNGFHGTAYEFNRVSNLASNDFDNNANGVPKPVFTRNQFGFSVGGPVIKDKLFFFSNTEWTRVRSQSYRTVYVPTPEFIALGGANTQAYFKAFGALRPGILNLGTFSRAQFAASGYNICNGLAASSPCLGIPQNTPLFQRISYGYPSDSGGGAPQNTYNMVHRVDYNISANTQIYVQYARYNESDLTGANSDSPYQGFDSPNSQINDSAIISVTRTVTPRFLSQSKIDFNRFNNAQPLGAQPAVPNLFLGSANTATSLLGTNVAFPGYLPYSPGNFIPFGGPQNFLQLYQDFSYTAGSHNIRFGGTYSYLRDNRVFGAYAEAIQVLGSNVPRGIENFLNGNQYNFQAAVNPQGKYPCGATVTPDCTLNLPVGQPDFSRSNRYHDWALYAQDAWKLTPRLTLNLGLRWEVFGTQHNKNEQLDSNFYLGSGSNIYQQIAAGSVQLAPNSPIGKLWNTDYNNFAPRVGFAWDLFGRGTTSLRGGYGIGYERNYGNVTFNVIQNPPNYAVLSLFAGTDLPTIPISTSNAGPLAGSTGSKALGAVSLRAVDPNIQTAYAHFWSAAIEHRLREGMLFAIEYSGSHGVDQYGIANVNRPGSAPDYLGTACTPTPDDSSNPFGTCGGRLRSSQYSNINFRTNGGFSTYNGVNFRLDVRSRGGVNLRANYTWSHAIDTLSDTFSSSANQPNLGWLDPFNPGLDKGDALFDVRHRFTLAGTWDIPGHKFNNWADYAFGGWTLAPIFSIQTGSPFSLYDCTYGYSVCPYAMFTAKVPKTPDTPLTATDTPNRYVYLDVSGKTDSSFYNPKIGVSDFGPFPSNMIGRNFFRGPGSWNLDMGLYKSFRFSERTSLQLRGEAYNLFNHANLSANVGDYDVSSIPYVSASYFGRRQLQLGAKFIF